MRSIKAKLLVTMVSVTTFITLILFVGVMILLNNQRKDMANLAVTQTQNTVSETRDTLTQYQIQVANEFGDASAKYFGNVFSNIHRHTISVAEKAQSLYVNNEHVAELDDAVGIVGGSDMNAIRDEFAVIAPIRDFIAYLPSYDVSKLAELDIYVMTDSGMCLDGTFDALGEYPDLRVEHWFINPRDTGSLYWSGVVAGQVTGKAKVACSAPIYDANGKFKGVAVGDMAVASFQNILEEYNAKGINSVVFFDKNEELMYATNDYQKTDEVGRLLRSGATLKYDDNEIYVIRRMEETGWSICLVLDAENITTTLNNVEDSIVSNAEENNKLVQHSINRSAMIFVFIALFSVLNAVFVARIASKEFTKPINSLVNEVALIGEGNLDVNIEITTKDEIGKLSEAFNKMTKDLKDYMENLQNVTREKERIGAELDVATHIQSSMLPCIFPPFPDRKEFDICAAMDPAKEVGGDFYDFFMVDDRHVAIVMADVSGKGVPAALFMVIGKTLIKDHTVPGRNLTDVFYEVNNILCGSNSEMLFITAFEGVLDLVTGEFTYVNAGHETPFICHPGGVFEPYEVESGFVLAGMEEMSFSGGSFMLEPGARLFQYTDGVPEATNADNELYGMERLEAVLKANSGKNLIQILPAVRADVDAFVGDAPQFDDLTMLCIEYKERMVV